VYRSNDAVVLAEHRLRYDLTVTLAGDIGGELIKTAGHIHSNAPDGAGYPEIYDVLHGQAAFVLQFSDPLRVVVAVCGRGERILIPPDASHLTVNIGDEPLVVADLVAIDSQNDYGDFRDHRGAAAYLLADPDEEDGFEIAVNSAYDDGPDIYLTQSSVTGVFVPADEPLYTHFRANPAHYGYLTAPAPRSAEMRALWSISGSGSIR
jgi:glucose-6-phosphate isomerase, archaeal